MPFDTDFLRFMLSDGAGAAILQNSPAPSGLSLRIEWIDNKSYANSYDVCMYAGLNKDKGKDKGEDKDNRNHASWLDYRSVHDAADDGAVNLKQDIRLVNEMPKVGVDRFFELVEEGAVDPSAIDWMVCHYSSHFFRDEIFRLLKLGGLTIPEEKWFTNLYTKGNTGAASIYIMLEELLGSGKLSPGERVLCMVPESGRFQTSYMLMTVVGSRDESPRAPFEERAPEAPKLKYDSTNDIQAGLVRQLVRVWIDFEQKLSRVPVIHKLYQGKFTMNDYKSLMENIRQQVIDGSQWIARAASYIPIEHIDLRSTFIAHARDEHRDFQILERNYVSVGGDLAAIQAGEKNIGSEALSAYLFQRASRDNPVDLIGAMWIIEGLGCRMARYWGEMIRDQLGLDDEQVSFLLYHSDSDELHFERLETVVQHPLLTADIAARIVKTAKTTARLYLLQLEELNHV